MQGMPFQMRLFEGRFSQSQMGSPLGLFSIGASPKETERSPRQILPIFSKEWTDYNVPSYWEILCAGHPNKKT
jgi:hypothetical protein